jgi:hypothetical protein
MNPAEPIDQHGRVRIYGDVNAVILPNWSITEDQYGLLTGSISYRYESQNIMSSAIPSIGQFHPFNGELRSYKGSVNHGGGGNAVMTLDYIGIGNGRTQTIPEIEVSGSSSSQNVVLHPKFSDFALEIPPDKDGLGWKYKPYVNTVDKNGVDFEVFDAIKSPEGLRGVDSYYVQRTTVRVSFYTYNTGNVSQHLNGIGCYREKPYGVEGFNGIPTGGNYLLTSCSASKYGTAYKVSAEWTSSEQGVKWSTILYRAWGMDTNAQATIEKYSLGASFTLGSEKYTL